MANIPLYTIFSFLVFLTEFFPLVLSDTLNSSCIVNDWKNSTGICQPLRDCGSALSNLRSGIKPNLCDVPEQKGIVCCPTTPRKSEVMCEFYKNILKDIEEPLPLLPIEFIPVEHRTRELKCRKYLTKFIVGGRSAEIDEFPHVVALGWGSNETDLSWHCAATLISEEFLLTSAQCVETKYGKPTYVLLGDIRQSSRIGQGRTIVKIVEHVIHPEYRKPLWYNDIALLRLESTQKLNHFIFPACLPNPTLRLENKIQVTTLGWGQLGTLDQSSDILQVVNLTRFGRNECNEYYKDQPEKPLAYPRGILRSQLCAGDHRQEKGSCRGDAGGSLTVTANNDKLKCIYYLLGITSSVSSICGIQPGVYTNVQSYLDWIEKIVWA